VVFLFNGSFRFLGGIYIYIHGFEYQNLTNKSPKVATKADPCTGGRYNVKLLTTPPRHYFGMHLFYKLKPLVEDMIYVTHPIFKLRL